MEKEATARLTNWFLMNGRDLPWRIDRTPYTTLVSEIMLQQTQASRVISFFTNWMELFPGLEDLAKAPLSQVMKAWEGLGYYKRARSLHEAALFIQSRMNGEIPDSKESLLQIPSIGPYTAGAILCFGFQKKEAAVDVNVGRVLTRLYDLPLSLQKASSMVTLRELLHQALPDKDPSITMEAFVELGALICTKKPFCEKCPLRRFCKAFKNNTVDSRPIPAPSKEYTSLFRNVFICTSQGKYLLILRKEGEIMAGLYEFPYLDKEEDLSSFQKRTPESLSLITTLPQVSHSFTRYRVKLFPYLIFSEKPFPYEEGEWVPEEKLSSLTFSSGMRKILKLL